MGELLKGTLMRPIKFEKEIEENANYGHLISLCKMCTNWEKKERPNSKQIVDYLNSKK